MNLYEAIDCALIALRECIEAPDASHHQTPILEEAREILLVLQADVYEGIEMRPETYTDVAFTYQRMREERSSDGTEP